VRRIPHREVRTDPGVGPWEGRHHQSEKRPSVSIKVEVSLVAWSLLLKPLQYVLIQTQIHTLFDLRHAEFRVARES
jgi:hypothetical protein